MEKKTKTLYLITDPMTKMPVPNEDGAMMVYRSLKEARQEAADNWGYDSYRKCKKDGWVEIVKFVSAK